MRVHLFTNATMMKLAVVLSIFILKGCVTSRDLRDEALDSFVEKVGEPRGPIRFWIKQICSKITSVDAPKCESKIREWSYSHAIFEVFHHGFHDDSVAGKKYYFHVEKSNSGQWLFRPDLRQ